MLTKTKKFKLVLSCSKLDTYSRNKRQTTKHSKGIDFRNRLVRVRIWFYNFSWVEFGKTFKNLKMGIIMLHIIESKVPAIERHIQIVKRKKQHGHDQVLPPQSHVKD